MAPASLSLTGGATSQSILTATFLNYEEKAAMEALGNLPNY